MYSHVYEEMEDAGIAIKLVTPKWQNQDGKDCAEEDAFGCKITHYFPFPEMGFVMDEVGGNTSQKGDGHMGGSC